MIAFLRSRRLITTKQTCHCGSSMKKERSKRSIDGEYWRCQDRACRTKCSIRLGSFFHNSKLSLRQIITIVYYWAIECPFRTLAREAYIKHQTVSRWINRIRKVISIELSRNPPRVGGRDATGARIRVNIDETLVSRKKPTRNGHGRYTPQVWLFGAVDSLNNIAIEICDPDLGRTAAALIPKIKRMILPGSHILSDEWRAYNSIGRLEGYDYEHTTINHSQYFVDPSGFHTNWAEGLWALVKRSFARSFGVRRTRLQDYINVFMWRYSRKTRKDFYFDEIMISISRAFPLE